MTVTPDGASGQGILPWLRAQGFTPAFLNIWTDGCAERFRCVEMQSKEVMCLQVLRMAAAAAAPPLLPPLPPAAHNAHHFQASCWLCAWCGTPALAPFFTQHTACFATNLQVLRQGTCGN